MSSFSRVVSSVSSSWNCLNSAHSCSSVSSGMLAKNSGTCPRVCVMSCSVSDRLIADLRSARSIGEECSGALHIDSPVVGEEPFSCVTVFADGHYVAETFRSHREEVPVARVEMYSMEWCPYCAKAKALLGAKGIEYEEVDVTDDEAKAIEMVERTGQRGVPQFFIDDQWIGGYDSLAYLNATGALDQMFGIESTVDLEKVWDVAVVGGGPAGLSAAMYAARKNLSTILIALDLGGQVGITHLVTNYPGMPVVEGPELVRLMF